MFTKVILKNKRKNKLQDIPTNDSPPPLASTEMPAYDWQRGKSLAESNKHMLLNEIGCDVAFMVGENRTMVYAHKFVLTSRSCVFCAMLYGPLAERTDDYIVIPDIEPRIFRQMLEYLYTDDTKVDIKNAPKLLYAAHKYGIDGLEEKCVKCLEHGIVADNVCFTLQQAYKFEEAELKKKCLDYIYHQPKDILKSSAFCELPMSLVCDIVKSDELDANEESIFEALSRWSEMECLRQDFAPMTKFQRRVIGDMIYHIRFTLMTANYFNSNVVRSELLSHEEMRELCDFRAGKITELKRFKTGPRSTGEHQTLHWRFGPVSCLHNDETAISFSASCEVLVEGVQIDGSLFNEETYDVDLCIYDSNSKELAKTKTKISIKRKTSYYKVTFAASPKIDKGYKYTVILKISGSHGYYGTSGKSSLPVRGNSSTCVVSEGDFCKESTRNDHVPMILLKPYIPPTPPKPESRDT